MRVYVKHVGSCFQVFLTSTVVTFHWLEGTSVLCIVPLRVVTKLLDQSAEYIRVNASLARPRDGFLSSFKCKLAC